MSALAILAALAAALANAASSVLQRQAATQSQSGRGSAAFVARLVRHPLYLAGLVTMVVAFGLPALALSQGSLSLVAPLLVSELESVSPLALLSRWQPYAVAAAGTAATALSAQAFVANPWWRRSRPSSWPIPWSPSAWTSSFSTASRSSPRPWSLQPSSLWPS